MKRILFLLAFLFAAIFRINAQVADVYADKGMQLLSAETQYFVDSTAALTIEDVAQPAILAKFKPVTGRYVAFPITSSVVWAHFKIVVHANETFYLRNDLPLINDCRLYKRNGAAWEVYRSGLDIPAETRDVRAATIAFRLRQQQGDTAEYFLRLASYYPMGIAPEAGPSETFRVLQLNDTIFAGIFFGIMLVMALYNLFLFLTNRDRVYIFYVLYVAGSVLFIALASGYIIVFPEIFRKIYTLNAVLLPAFFGYFGLLFTMRFLQTKIRTPRLHKLFYLLMLGVTTTIIIGFFQPYLGVQLIQVMGIVLSVICLVAGFTVYRMGYAPSRFYLLGFGIYMLGLLTYIVVALAGIDTGTMTPQRILMASSAIETIILSFAIGDKLNIALREKQAANDKVMEAVRENERIVREQNVILEKKVEERTLEINTQKEIIEEKNKDILDSIHYAKRIQRALLASDTMLAKKLPEHFVLYRPKDIVSGDFYWAAEVPGEKILLLTGDCTGHGVPGAFMSLLNISILHEITSGMNITSPEKVLNTQREAIIMSLNPEGSEEISKDGMDCVLCSFDFKNRKLEFACANNPLWVIRNGELFDFRPDKYPVGLHEGEPQPFTRHELDLLPGDVVYTFTDGYADQFGGPRGKKFKYAQLKEVLRSVAALPMHEQKTHLEKTFDDWKGELDQLDDMLVIGVKIR